MSLAATTAEPTPISRGWPFNKVFGIGLSKTGTTTLDGAFTLLGLRSVHYPFPERMVAGDLAFLDNLDAATDISITAYYRELDRRFPGSRFVMTTRPLEPWLASVERHFAARDPKKYLGDSPAGIIRERCYGRRQFDRAAFIDAFHRHHAQVRDYFRPRPGDLLEMSICNGEGWSVLCPFLGLPTPHVDFPHLHKQPTRPAPAAPSAAELKPDPSKNAMQATSFAAR